MDKLGIYNEALRLTGGRRLASLTEDRAPRRELDSIWATHAYDTWLEMADWKFALNFVKIQVNPSIDISFGYANAFDQPSDLVRVSGVWGDEYHKSPLTEYRDEAGKFYADIDEIYVSYVSNSASFGGNVGAWPNSFANYVAAFMADQMAPQFKNDNAAGEISKELKARKTNAMSKDAQKSPSKQMPQGSWSGSRGGRSHRNHGIPS